MNQMDGHPRAAFIFTFVIVSCAIVGYFVGLQSPMNPGERRLAGLEGSLRLDESGAIGEGQATKAGEDWTVLATDYSDMGTITKQRAQKWKSKLSELKSNVQLLAEVVIAPEDKALALARRENNRAFNGAPPTVPHPTNEMSSQTCALCHLEGAKTESLRISAMSHPYLENCTQCHVESYSGNDAAIFTRVGKPLWSDNSFDGLSAPTGGKRAFKGAPPQIPHSVWMRQNCSSCHGVNGLHGIRATHPWRTSCEQCHVGQAMSNQELTDEPEFLPPLNIIE